MTIGVGGHHLGDVPTLDEAVQLVHEAVDAGITFFDNAWEYYNGKTETILGRALRDGRREKVFLMTKVCTHGRSGKLAMQMLEDSLRRYQTAPPTISNKQDRGRTLRECCSA